jgi:hypothetical protein
MLIWGSGGKVVELGAAGENPCPTCEKDRPFRHVLDYRYFHIWYLFGWVTRKVYATVCQVCGHGQQHESRAFEAKLGKVPIPLHHRRGGVLLLGAIAALVLSVFVLGSIGSSRKEAMLAAPQVGDIYTARLDRLAPQHFDRAWGLVRVTDVEGDRRVLELPRSGYSKRKGTRRDLAGKANEDAYYSGTLLHFTDAELRDLGRSSHIVQVRRR